MAVSSSSRTNDAAHAYRDLVARCRVLVRHDPRRSVGEIALTLNVCERTLNRAYRVVAGTTVREERARVRLEAAAAALLERRGLQEAARRAGYRHARHLAGPFRRHFGVTPMEMRRAGTAIRVLRWQARQPPPFRGSTQARSREASWRAQKRVLRHITELLPESAARRRLQRALRLTLKRPVEPPRPLGMHEVFGYFSDWYDVAFVDENVRSA